MTNLVEQKSAWGLLFLSALGLELTALYFQYVMDLAPCIMCIYQRTAILGVMVSSAIPLLTNNFMTRFVALLGWGISAIWGLIIAMEHVEIQTAVNPFFASCEIVPNFPSWAPLHEWLPQIFAATGDCGNIDWSFMDISMPQWMIIVFGIYTVLLAAVLISRLAFEKKL